MPSGMFRRVVALYALFALLSLNVGEVGAGEPNDGSVLPFPPVPSASVAGPTLQESKHQRRVEKSHLPADAPNILIIMLDDVGFGHPEAFGGTRTPLAVAWPARIKPDKTPRPQFHHVNDIAPTIYEILAIAPPKVVDGFTQDPIDGVSMVYSFADPKASSQNAVQYFDNNGSRGIYHDGWYACTFGPFVPWDTAGSAAKLMDWNADNDIWELYDLRTDYSQANNLAARDPQRLAAMKALFLEQARENKVFPIGAGNWLRLHPEDRIKTPYTSWRFDATTTRMPEFTAPGLGRESTRVTITATLNENASGCFMRWAGRAAVSACSWTRVASSTSTT